MNSNKKNSNPISNWVIFLIMITVIFNMNGFSRIVQNGSGSGYLEGGDNPSGISGIKSGGMIETLVEQGAGYFLAGHSCIQEFLQRYELQDLNGIAYDRLDRSISCALDNIAMAGATYTQLIQIAEMTPYNPVVIAQLKAFDYESFLKENGLNAVIFAEVRSYLENGDITGSLKHSRSGLLTLRWLLASIYNDISLKRLPPVETLWKLNETCAEVSLFGSFAARIFAGLK